MKYIMYKFEQLQSDLNKYKEVLERIHKIAGTIKGKGTKQAFEIWNIIDDLKNLVQ